MALNESIRVLADQGIREVGVLNIAFGFKVLIFFGFFYMLTMLGKTSGSLIYLLLYIIGFFKWVIFKIMRKDI